MKCAFHPDYCLSLPQGHPFPMGKYALLKERLLANGSIAERDLVEPGLASRAMLERVHDAAYLNQLEAGELSAADQRRLGIPWSERLWQRSRRACGGTLLAARHALHDGLAANLAGGTHHAFADHAEGFCVLNDVAVAICTLLDENKIARALVIDLDVHQGNGTAAIFSSDPRVFTFSMHGARNYPARKMRSTLDIELADETGDAEYLDILQAALPDVLDTAAPELVCYIAGVDVAAGDRYGRLALSETGITRRERCVIETIRRESIALTIVLGGGYAKDTARTAELHALVFKEAAAWEACADSRQAPAPPSASLKRPSNP